MATDNPIKPPDDGASAAGGKPPAAAGAPHDDIGRPHGETTFLVNEIVKGEGTRAWTALSAKIVFYLRSRFGHSSFPRGIEFTDFVSEVMVKVLSSIQNFEDRGQDSFWRWVQTLAGNLWRDLWRRFDRDRRLGLVGHGNTDTEDGPPRGADAAVAAGESPTQAVRFRELEKAEAECVQKLPKQMRDVYLMRRQHDLAFAEISANVGGIKEATLRSHYMRAREYIRACLGEKLDELGKRITGWQ